MDTGKSWEKFLHPESLRGNLIAISLFISAYEMFKESVIEKPRTFFSDQIFGENSVLSDEYKTEVLEKSKSPLYASLLWLQEIGAIDESDIQIFDSIRQHRNELAHDLMRYLSDANKNFDVSEIENLLDLYKKIEKWWVIEFELAINPLPENVEVNIDDVIPGPIWSIQLMLDIALGREPEEGYYYNAFKKIRT